MKTKTASHSVVSMQLWVAVWVEVEVVNVKSDPWKRVIMWKIVIFPNWLSFILRWFILLSVCCVVIPTVHPHYIWYNWFLWHCLCWFFFDGHGRSKQAAHTHFCVHIVLDSEWGLDEQSQAHFAVKRARTYPGWICLTDPETVRQNRLEKFLWKT